jgi:expansin (peptidoglycan-binding protein)
VNATDRAARHTRRRSKRGGLWLAAAWACAAGVLTAALVITLAPGHQPDTGLAATTPYGGTSPAAPVLPGASAPTPSASAAAAVSTSRPASSAAARPSASSSPRVSTAGAASLAGRIKPGVTYHGVATEYAAADGDGACLFGPAADMMIGAMNYTDYESAKACGAYVLVRAASGATLKVLITNECPLPCAPGQIDLSQQAFAKLANPSAGRIPITWSLLSPGLSNTISIRYKTGSSQYWCGIQVIGHRNPVAQLAVRVGGSWRQLSRTDYNYFLSPSGSGCGGPIRVTDIYGQSLTIYGIALLPNVAQSTVVQFAEH